MSSFYSTKYIFHGFLGKKFQNLRQPRCKNDGFSNGDLDSNSTVILPFTSEVRLSLFILLSFLGTITVTSLRDNLEYQIIILIAWTQKG